MGYIILLQLEDGGRIVGQWWESDEIVVMIIFDKWEKDGIMVIHSGTVDNVRFIVQLWDIG